MRKAVSALAVALILVSLAGLALMYLPQDTGSGRGHGAQNAQAAQSQNLAGMLLFAVPLVAALAVIAYGALFPQIKHEKPDSTQAPIAAAPTDKREALEAVLRVLNEDERKVVQALADWHEGFMLQKDIRWKTGLSRVKTHRVIARLSARGIVKAEKYYNTNKVSLADWIVKNEKQPTDS
jgi:uncharacterized membrane protein